MFTRGDTNTEADDLSALGNDCNVLISFGTSSLVVCVQRGDVSEWPGDTELSPTLALA